MSRGITLGRAIWVLTALGSSLPNFTFADGSERGIKILTEETYKEAIACGRSGAECAVAPFQLCPAEVHQYSAWIATPFSRVASSVFERLNRRQRPRPMELGPANEWGLGIYVSPKEKYEGTDSIQRVVIRRAGRTIEPTTATIAPVMIDGDGRATRQLARAFFAFPMDTLSPGADVEIVLTGTSGDVTCTIGRDKVQALR